MRLAVIDLGTNSIRYEAFDISSPERIEPIHSEREMVHLGDELFVHGCLSEEAIARTIATMRRLAARSRELRITRTVCIGTSALREASDADEFLSRAEEALGVTVDVVSGDTEATLIAEGISANEPVARGAVTLIDIGGGSTEIIFAHDKRIDAVHSLSLGVARLRQRFFAEDPVATSDAHLHEAASYITEQLATTPRTASREDITYVGSSGTFRTLSRLFAEGPVLERAKIEQLLKLMRPMTAAQVLTVPGMEASRAPFAFSGAFLVQQLFAYFSIARLHVTKYSLRHGVLAREIARLSDVT